MKTIYKLKIIVGTTSAEYPFNVQLWQSYDGGKSFWYAGYGRFCRNADEIDAYAKDVFRPMMAG